MRVLFYLMVLIVIKSSYHIFRHNGNSILRIKHHYIKPTPFTCPHSTDHTKAVEYKSTRQPPFTCIERQTICRLAKIYCHAVYHSTDHRTACKRRKDSSGPFFNVRARHLFLPQLGSRTTIKQYGLVRNRNLLGHYDNILPFSIKNRGELYISIFNFLFQDYCEAHCHIINHWCSSLECFFLFLSILTSQGPGIHFKGYKTV